jgi:transcription elongation factor Elf1
MYNSRGRIGIYTPVWWYIMECPNCLSEKVSLKKSWLGKHCLCDNCKFDWEFVK